MFRFARNPFRPKSVSASRVQKLLDPLERMAANYLAKFRGHADPDVAFPSRQMPSSTMPSTPKKMNVAKICALPILYVAMTGTLEEFALAVKKANLSTLCAVDRILGCNATLLHQLCTVCPEEFQKVACLLRRLKAKMSPRDFHAFVNARTLYGRTAFWELAERSLSMAKPMDVAQTFRVLLSYGANPKLAARSTKTSEHVFTPLQLWTLNNDCPSVSMRQLLSKLDRDY